MRKFIKIFAVAIFASLLALLCTTFAIYLKYRSLTPPEKIEEIILTPMRTGDLKIGDKIEFASVFTCNWTLSPKSLELSLPEGLQDIPMNNFAVKKIGWGKWTWRVAFLVQPFRPGEYKEISGRMELSAKGSKMLEAVLKIPPLSVKKLQVKANDPIKLAGKIEKKKVLSKKMIVIGIIILLILIVIMFAIFAMRKKFKASASSTPPWRVALLLLEELRISQKRGILGAQFCVLKLSDIIRNYVEQRFGIDAPTMTTEEFLDDLRKSCGPLSDADRRFLSDFMQSAELVKFANAPADTEIVEKAISDAERFVEASVPKDCDKPETSDKEDKK
jgi:hypothetical protein